MCVCVSACVRVRVRVRVCACVCVEGIEGGGRGRGLNARLWCGTRHAPRATRHAPHATRHTPHSHTRQADTVVFDDELSPGQLRNLEKAFSGAQGGKQVRVGLVLVLCVHVRLCACGVHRHVGAGTARPALSTLAPAHARAPTHSHTRVHTHAHIPTHIPTHTHAHIHIPARAGGGRGPHGAHPGHLQPARAHEGGQAAGVPRQGVRAWRVARDVRRGVLREHARVRTRTGPVCQACESVCVVIRV
jgi:hypothetical protein